MVGLLGWPFRASRTASAALCALVLAACSDGQPTDDVSQIDPARMTEAQVLAEVNAMDKGQHLGKRWRCVMHAGCELEISTSSAQAAGCG